MKKFIPCLDVSGDYFQEIVRPIIDREFPGLKYTAALIGSGSEVIGMDTEISSDHDWAPRVFIFISEAEYSRIGTVLEEAITRQRPESFKGYALSDLWNPDDIRSRIVFTVDEYWRQYLGVSANSEVLLKEWLTLPQHRLLGISSGRVYHDHLEDFGNARKKFAYYPDEVWFYALASQWKKIAEEQPFLGRYRDLGDDLGFRIMLAKLVKDVMRLHYLIKRTYFPYNKWFTSYYSRIGDAKLLLESLMESDIKKAEEKFFENLKRVADDFNGLRISGKIKPSIGNFHTRPYKVINADDYAGALKRKLKGTDFEGISLHGTIDQWADSVVMNESYKSAKKLQASFE